MRVRHPEIEMRLREIAVDVDGAAQLLDR